MKYHGITGLSVIPMRKEPAHSSEQVSQLLFGELYDVFNHHKTWLHIRSIHDGYEGWLPEVQHTEIKIKDYSQYLSNKPGLALDLVCTAASSADSIPLVAGSNLPFFDGLNFKLLSQKYVYNGQAVPGDARHPSLLERVCYRYLNAPYLWGGRSPFGIDCSGFTQVVFKFLGVSLLRDAYQQSEQGTPINFVEESQPGDLAFFSDKEGKIVHTGIILKEGRIIHASGKVKIQKLDHYGIFDEHSAKYSHHLKSIRRIF